MSLDGSQKYKSAPAKVKFNQETEGFILNVLDKEGLVGWKYEVETIDPMGFCHKSIKLFTIPHYMITNRDDFALREYILHEITHALDVNDNGKSHNAHFYKIYARLLIEYME